MCHSSLHAPSDHRHLTAEMVHSSCLPTSKQRVKIPTIFHTLFAKPAEHENGYQNTLCTDTAVLHQMYFEQSPTSCTVQFLSKFKCKNKNVGNNLYNLCTDALVLIYTGHACSMHGSHSATSITIRSASYWDDDVNTCSAGVAEYDASNSSVTSSTVSSV